MVQATRCVELPAGLDTIRAAALADPGMSSWATLKERAYLAPGEKVLINGATGTSGRLAVRIAKHLGAGRVIATGRNAHTLASLSVLGADATLSLAQDKEALERGFQTHFREGVDVVLDYLCGESAEVLMDAAVKATSEAAPIRFVQVGSVSAPTISLPGAVLRSSALELMGSGFNSVPLPRLVKAVGEMLAAAASGGFEIAIKALPLAQIAEHWSDVDSAARVVFTTELDATWGRRRKRIVKHAKARRPDATVGIFPVGFADLSRRSRPSN